MTYTHSANKTYSIVQAHSLTHSHKSTQKYIFTIFSGSRRNEQLKEKSHKGTLDRKKKRDPIEQIKFLLTIFKLKNLINYPKNLK